MMFSLYQEVISWMVGKLKEAQLINLPPLVLRSGLSFGPRDRENHHNSHHRVVTATITINIIIVITITITTITTLYVAFLLVTC